MIEQIQKSYKLINFNDSSFDQSNNHNHHYDQVTDDKTDPMLKSTFIERRKKLIPYKDLINLFLFSNTDELNLDDETIRDLIVIYEPFMNSSPLEKLIDEAIIKNTSIFGCAYLESKVADVLGFKRNAFEKTFNIEEIVVLKKEIECQISLSMREDFKSLAAKLAIMEGQIYCSIRLSDLYECDIAGHVAIFNNLTSVFISQILKENSSVIQIQCVKNLLKLARYMFDYGTMNCFGSCILALQSTSVHRLKLIDGLDRKYKKRFEFYSNIMSPEKNFKSLRERPCLIPWFGLILRDFTFVQEVIFSQSFKSDDYANIPLGLCLRRLVLPILVSREACILFLKEQIGGKGQTIESVAILRKWLENGSGIIYLSEGDQFQRSLAITRLIK